MEQKEKSVRELQAEVQLSQAPRRDFADKGSQTVKDRLKRVILQEANSKSGTTTH